MKIKDLIKALEDHDPESIVLVQGYETGFDSIRSLQLKSVVLVRHPEDHDGQYRDPKDLPAPDDADWPELRSPAVQAAEEQALKTNPQVAVVIMGFRRN